MDWSNFNCHGDAPTRAFESFTGILFERWCRREYSSQVRQVIFVNGAGGDGGVEAYAQLKNGDLIGLQAKWFRESLQSSQISQIKSSLNTAVTQRPGLIHYVVAVPRDLSDVRRTGKNVKTERDRWNGFITSSEIDNPGITVELWDETRISALLAELGSEGLSRYWFEDSVSYFDSLQTRFKQAQSGWLANRYAPDLHQSGQIEQDLQLRLNGPSSHPTWLQEVRNIQALLKKARITIQRLRRYPEFTERPNAETLIQGANTWLEQALTEEAELENHLSAPSSFPVASFNNALELGNLSGLEDLRVALLPEEGSTAQDEAVKPIHDELWKIRECWYERQCRPMKLQTFSKAAIYIGEPGVGKTHALANMVQKHLSQHKPAVLLRAKDLDLTKSWDSLLAEAIGESGWNLRQVLDALEAGAMQSEVRAMASPTPESKHFPVRALIAIDGLDETPKADCWAEKLGELVAVAPNYPRILFAFSARSSLMERISVPDQVRQNLHQIWLSGSDAPLAEIFEAHCQINRIQCPPLLRWALRTPLAIRLFAELYRDQHLDTISLQEFSLVNLIKKKINHTEQSIREREEEPWSDSVKPVRASLRAIASAYVEKGTALSQEEAINVVESAQPTSGILTRPQLLRILEHCRDRGLLLHRSLPSDDPLEEETYTWELAYETLTDYLLASEACKEAQVSTTNPDLPQYLKNRPNATKLAIYLLGKEGFNVFASELWKNDLTGQRREDFQLEALSMLPPQQSEAYREWVTGLFTQDMSSCRRVLDILIVPGLRIPGYIYDARFVHEILLPMKVANRDLFWSCPYYVPRNHSAKWEGLDQARILETLEPAEDDPWDSAPLLLAWATTTVDNNNRRRIRAALADWGYDKPRELLALLQTALQTNDPQMKEDLLTVAYGASCLTRPDATWLPLCDWIINNFFTPNALHRTHNLIIRHCARSLVERCWTSGTPITKKLLAHLQVPVIDLDELLPIDKDGVLADSHLGAKPATRDLAWYVVPNAISHFWGYDCLSNSPLTQSLLRRHTSQHDLRDLTLGKLAFGFVRAYALSLGWSEDVFIRKPQGGEVGEILGADVAIKRQYDRATHGAQSPISSFGEKYVWVATHELTGFLADRVPAYRNNTLYEPPIDFSLLTSVINPATDIGYDQSACDAVIDFSTLVPDTNLSELVQIDLVNEWIQKAPLPPIEPLLLLESSQLPSWAQAHKWLVLKAFVIERHMDSQAESVFWASSFACPSIAISLMGDCARSGAADNLHEFHANVKTMEFYQDPCEMVWSPRILEEQWISHVTCDVTSKSKQIPLLAATCKVYWQSPEEEKQEEEEWIPTKWLSKLLGIVDFHAGKFFNIQGDVIGFTMKKTSEDWEGHKCHLLLARRDVLLSTLASKNLTLAWGTRLYREPSYPLNLLSEKKRMFRDWRATAYLSTEGLLTFTSEDLTKAWYSV